MLIVPAKQYRVGHDYRDTGSVSAAADQFLGWINLPQSGMRNMGGIRPLKFLELKEAVPAFVVLVTDERSAGSNWNPWDDSVDLHHGRIDYWGDAKFHATWTVDRFPGNRALKQAFDHVLDGRLGLVPPILHFSKKATGYLRFNGLCVLDRLELTWFEDQGRPVRNYRAHLTILDEEFIDVAWLHSRVRASSPAELFDRGPRVWQQYQQGVIHRLRVWAPRVRAVGEQLPPVGSNEDRVLRDLVSLSPREFELAVVAIFNELDEVRHDIEPTRYTADGGFDFVGTFTLPPPIQYEIPFRGEAKRYSRTTAVGPKDVSRLVARLGRGQYGVFVTTSYFTRQAQEEVLEDRYPTTLVAGSDLVRIMREVRISAGASIKASWLHALRQESTPQAPVTAPRAAERSAPYGLPDADMS